MPGPLMEIRSPFLADQLTIRIAGGQLRGRKLSLPNRDGLRPTPSRARETLFNWLQGWVEGRRVLDLFAGAGTLSFEAASRGASEVVAIERDKSTAKALDNTAKTWGVSELQVITGCALSTPLSGEFDLIFIDPPFGQSLLAPALEKIRPHLAADAMVAVEHEAGVTLPEGWGVLKSTKVGADHLLLIEAE